MPFLSRAALSCLFALAAPAMASAACPSHATPGAPLSYTADSAMIVQSTDVVAGGDIDLATCADIPGTGFVVETPDFSIRYDDQGQGRALELRVSAGCDAVLLVNTATGDWLFNDDASGTDPALRIEAAPSGRYDVWVGTFGMESCAATLDVETF